MKALEPVLKHHFWILLGLGLILALIGWWMTTGSMQAATATARGDLKKADDDRNVGDVPSDDWTKNLKVINAGQKSLVDRTWASLFAQQKEQMVWPEIVAEAASKLKYRESFENPILKTVYRDNYYKEVERVYRIPRPIDELDDSGIVHFPLAALPHIEWGDLTPTYQQMWDTMEDLWLLEPILQAVFVTNGGENAKRHEAVVVAIEYLGLFGGDRSKIGQEGQQGGGGTEGGAKGAGGMVSGPSMNMPVAGDAKAGGLMGGAGGGGGSQTIATDIKEVEEFGDPGSGNKGGGGNAGPGGPGSAGGTSSSNSSSTASEGPRRYIDDDKAMPFRTRGFKLTVAMDHRKVPDLYAHLTSSESSPWPIQILRMNVARLSESGAAPGGGGGGGRKERRGGGAFGGLGGGGGGGLGGGGGGGGGLVGGGNPGGNQPGGEIAGNASSASEELVNPFLSRVTIVGLITLYNEPPASESASGAPAGSSPTLTQPVTNNDPPAEPKTGEPATTLAEDSAAEGTESSSPADDVEKTDPEKTDAPLDDAAPQDNPAGEPGESKPTDDETKDKPAASEPESETTQDAGAPEPK